MDLNEKNNELKEKLENFENNRNDSIELNNLKYENNELRLQNENILRKLKEAENNINEEKKSSKEVITSINSKLIESGEKIESLKNEILNLKNQEICKKDLLERYYKLETDYTERGKNNINTEKKEKSKNDLSSLTQYEIRSSLNSESYGIFRSSSQAIQNFETKPKAKRTFKPDLNLSISSSQGSEFSLKTKKAFNRINNTNNSMNESIKTSPTIITSTSISNKLTLVKLENFTEKRIPIKRKIDDDDDVICIDLTSDSDELPDLTVYIHFIFIKIFPRFKFFLII